VFKRMAVHSGGTAERTSCSMKIVDGVDGMLV
jgi:hypothetical protein